MPPRHLPGRSALVATLGLAWPYLVSTGDAAAQTAPQVAPQWGSPNTTVNPPRSAGGMAQAQKPAWSLGASAPSSLSSPSSPSAGPAAQATVKAAAVGGLFSLPDNAPITANGKATTAGALKQSIKAELAAKAGPPKTVKAVARKIDPDLVAVQPQGVPVRNNDGKAWGGVGQTVDVHKQSPAVALNTRPALGQTSSTAKASANPKFNDLNCSDKGPPVISEVQGRLKPGGKVSVWGRCFGDRSGHVEVIGQFPGGKLNVAFTAWDQVGIDLQVPANIRQATDHSVAVTVVTADGRRSPAMQAQFVAAREQIEVPSRLWVPGSSFEMAATKENGDAASAHQTNPAAAGQLQRNLRINPQCALDSMSVDVLSGNVNEIRGFEQGPPNEAAVTIDWVGTCIDTAISVSHDYGIASSRINSVRSACRVALQPRAWAYCPAGVSP